MCGEDAYVYDFREVVHNRGSGKNIWQCPETFLPITVGMLLASSGERPGRPLNFLQSQDSPPNKELSAHNISSAKAEGPALEL